MLWGEERVHVRGFGGGDAAADGAEPPPHAAHAYRHPVPHHVSPTGRLRHEHPVPPHRQAGLHQTPAKYLCFLQRVMTTKFYFVHYLSLNTSVGYMIKFIRISRPIPGWRF